MKVSIDLTDEQLASIYAQQHGSPPVSITPTPDPVPYTPPPAQPPVAGVRIIPFPWANTPNTSIGDIGHDEVIAIEVQTGNISSTGSLAIIRGSEFDTAPPYDRIAVLSFTPGDFDHPVDNAPGATIAGQSPTARFAVGSGSGFGYYPVVPLNTKVYLNVKNKPAAKPEDWPASLAMQFSVSVNQL